MAAGLMVAGLTVAGLTVAGLMTAPADRGGTLPPTRS